MSLLGMFLFVVLARLDPSDWLASRQVLDVSHAVVLAGPARSLSCAGPGLWSL